MKNRITNNGMLHFAVLAIIMILFIPSAIVAQSTKSTVNLGTSGDFVILGKAGITTTGTTNVTGDIGISPQAASFITGFGLIMDVSNTYSTSSLVTGKIYAADYTVPTPEKMTTAIGDMETAYNDAAGRLLPDYTELYSGDLTGQTLTPGLYNWSTNVLIGSGGVTITGTSTDIFIFQVAQNLELGSGAMVTLTGGVSEANIFWQVAGQVTLGTTASMKGIILCKTQIIMETGSTLKGRALAQTAVTLDASTVTEPDMVSSVFDGQLPSKYVLNQNYPNPFNPSTTITFGLPEKTNVKISVYNLAGQLVTTLVNEVRAAGVYKVALDGTKMSSGVYFYELKTDKFKEVKKLVLLK